MESRASVLSVLPELPWPPRSGGALRTYHLTAALAERFDVRLLCAAGSGTASVGELGMPLAGVAYSSGVPAIEALAGAPRKLAAGAFWRLTPRAGAFRFSARLRAALVHELREHDFRLVVIEHSYLGIYGKTIRKHFGGKAVISTHNCESVYFRRQLSKLGNRGVVCRLLGRLQAKAVERLEGRLSRWFDLAVTVSERDREAFEVLDPHLQIEVVPNGVEAKRFAHLALDRDSQPILVFVGALDYPPNADGMAWFQRRVWQNIRRRVPKAQLVVVGRRPPDHLLSERPAGIEYVGEVKDVLPYLARARLSVCPVLSGSGTRLKILEAMAAGLPVVSTQVGAEGLDVIDGEHLRIVDAAEDFAGTVVGLLEDRQARLRLADAAARLVRKRYTWRMQKQRYIRAIERALAETTPEQPKGARAS